MEIINTYDINKAKREIERLVKQNSKVIVKAQTDEFNRKILETKKVDIIFGFESGKTKHDKLKQRDSGLNQVLCRLARENDIAIGIEFDELKKSDWMVLARIIQNIKLCKKYEIKILILSTKELNEKDLYSLLLTLGMDTKMASYASSNVIIK